MKLAKKLRDWGYSKRSVLGAVITTVPALWYFFRWIISLLADLNDAADAISKVTPRLQLPGLDSLSSAWFAVTVMAVGLWLVWTGRIKRSEIEANQKFEVRLAVLDQELRIAFFYAIQLLGEIQDHILKNSETTPKEEFFQRHFFEYRLRTYRSESAAFELAAKLPENRDTLNHVDALLKPAYKIFAEVDFIIARYRMDLSSARYLWGGVTSSVYPQYVKPLKHSLDVMWGYGERERIERDAIEPFLPKVIDP